MARYYEYNFEKVVARASQKIRKRTKIRGDVLIHHGRGPKPQFNNFSNLTN